MVSSVLEHTLGHLITSKEWTLDDPIAADHFRDGPKVVPGLMIAEQAAQSALLLAMLDGLAKQKELFFLANVRCEFIAPALVPCSTIIETALTATIRGCIGFQSQCMVGDQVVARIKGIAAPPSNSKDF